MIISYFIATLKSSHFLKNYRKKTRKKTSFRLSSVKFHESGRTRISSHRYVQFLSRGLTNFVHFDPVEDNPCDFGLNPSRDYIDKWCYTINIYVSVGTCSNRNKRGYRIDRRNALVDYTRRKKLFGI